MSKGTLKEYIDLTKKLSRPTLDMITAGSDAEFDVAFESWLIDCVSQMEADAKGLQNLNEDLLSSFLAAALRTGEISATREQNSNGHVDITITLNNSSPPRKKLGEAKIWRGNSYHIEGLGQLLGRYSTGRECRGFVISYVKQKDIANLFAQLKDYIDKSKPYDLQGMCKAHGVKWTFLSSHKHSSGEIVDVSHIGCNLYHPPST